MKLIVSKDYFLTSVKAAQIIEEQLALKPASLIALPSGPTPVGMFEQLVLAYQAKHVDFTHAHFMGVDEYLGLAKDHPDSVANSLHERFFKPCNIRADQIHLIDGAADPDDACAAVNRFLDETGGLDLIVTGIGLNGHLAYNEPAEGLSPRVHVNGLGENTRLSLLKDFSDQTEIPSRIITLGLTDFLNARKLVVVATGPSKSSVVRRLVQSVTVSTFFPASFILLHRDATLIVDEVAGKELYPDSPVNDN
ncbi:MAG: glucosamine-6-phosphate deaminase [Erysipelotrichaceae bacterium]